jgi:hypothetical protein
LRQIAEQNKTFDDSTEPYKYYEGVASAFRYAKFIAIFAAVLFFVVMLSFFKDEISIENFQYVLKYISTDEGSIITTNKIHYPTSDSKALSLYKGDFVSSGGNGIALYDTNGSMVLEIEEAFSAPVFSTGKYGLCYDLSGNKYVIFNTFSELFTGTTEYPIADAVMSDKGDFVILTKSREYKSVIDIYDSDYELMGKVNKNNYVFCLDINDSYLSYATVSSADSRYLTNISALKFRSDDEIKVATLYDEFPLDMKFNNDGMFVLTDKSLRFYDSDFNQIASYMFASQTPAGMRISDGYVMVYFSKNMIGSENEVRIYDTGGKLVFSKVLTGKINSLDILDDIAVVHTNNLLYRINITDDVIETAEIVTGADKVMLQSDYTVLLCFDNFANLIDFNK